MNKIQLDPITIYLIGSSQLTDRNDCCVYLVFNQNDPDSSILIDAGAGSSQSIKTIIRNIENIGTLKNIRFILVTHAHIDHIGGLKAIRSHLKRAKIIAHTYAAKVIEDEDPILSVAKWYQRTLQSTDIDINITQKYSIKLSVGHFDVIPTPGHTPGSVIGLLTTPKGRVLFGQDIHGPFMPEFNSDIDQWRQSMQDILCLESDYLCEGHFGIIEGKDKVRQFIERYLRQFISTPE